MPSAAEEAYARQASAVAKAVHAAARSSVNAGLGKGAARVRMKRAASKAISAINFAQVAVQVDEHNQKTVNARIRELAGGRKVKQAKRSIVRDARLADAPASSVFVRQNVKLITKMSEEHISHIADIIEANEGIRWEDISKKIQERTEIERRADLIARDQVLTLNANLTQARHKELGIESYTWATAGDGDRVRKNHRALDGTKQRYDSPPMGGGTGPKDKGHPGEGIICRCQDIPDLPEDIFDEAPKPKPKKRAAKKTAKKKAA